MPRKQRSFLVIVLGIVCMFAIWTISDRSKSNENERFLSYFAGRWETEDQQMSLIFQENAGEIQLISQNIDEQEPANPQIMVVDEYEASRERWILRLKEDKTFCYSIMQTDEKEITAQSFINKPGVEGTAKPFNYRWTSTE
ncbi:hypothetical protein [Candidatus Enterococcus ferrettii]|uniref:DUF4828 domain-containing protein n=1 Tax=Candidatus Enterococcus ferrettii TaxID=2815324 RepID=A0ABV0ESV8_9ENTE|nr:hypothetical protein [Enterococcus sp. 665A]MBO1341485.1 hypothetical protein [Enterococcus sp. 665A]